MKVLFKCFLLAFVALVPCRVVAQEDLRSGNFYLPGCQAVVAHSLGDRQTMFRAGQCFGAVFVLQGFMKGSGGTCMDPNVPMGQILRVVLKFMEDHPARLNEDFVVLASNAIHDAWPCAAAKRH